MKRAIERDEDDENDEDVFDLTDERPLTRSRRRLPWLRMSVVSALCITALAYLAQQDQPAPGPPGPTSVPAATLIAPPPTWTTLDPAQPPYTLDKALGAAQARTRLHAGGGREDTLAVGALGEPFHAWITLSHGIPAPPRSFYLDIVRRAAEAGLAVERTAQTAMVATKFGPVESADVTLAGQSPQSCHAFRYREEDTSFSFQGWLCGTSAQPVERSHLACFIEALALTGPDDPALKAVFARSEGVRPQTCPPPARTASAGIRPSRP